MGRQRGQALLANGIMKFGTPSNDFSAQIVARMGDDSIPRSSAVAVTALETVRLRKPETA